MPTMPIEARKVAGVVLECNRVLKGQGFNAGEVLVGLSELIGRVIVETAQGPTQTETLKELVAKHVDDTVRIGMEAQGKRIITPGG